MPSLLTRAGFEVTLIAVPVELISCRDADRVIIVEGKDLLSRVLTESERGYELFLPGDDLILREIRDADISIEIRLRLLPVVSERGLGHIASKIGLSHALASAGIPTPQYTVARTRSDLPASIAEVGCPAMVKSDFGGGGTAVHRVSSAIDLESLPANFLFPALVQRYVEGELVDCSSYFHEGKLMHTSLSYMLAAERGGLGPSYLRAFDTHAHEDRTYTAIMQRLGSAIDANGFSNISAIRTTDGTLWFFEADMRPNAWVSYPRYFGNDPAIAVARAYKLPAPAAVSYPGLPPNRMIMCLPERLSPWALLLNRYRWRHYFEDYLGRGILLDQIRYTLARLTLRRAVNGIRAVFGLPPRARARR